jgi:hypothetical protein
MASNTFRLSCFAFFISLLILLSIEISYAQSIYPENIIPAYSSSFILVNDVPKVAKAIKASQAWQELMKTVEQEMNKNPKEAPGFAKFIVPNIWDIIELSTNRIAIVNINSEEFKKPSVIIDFGNAKSVIETAQKIMGMLNDNDKSNIILNAGKYLNIPYGIVKPDGRFAFLDNLFVYTPDQAILESLINVYVKEEPSISEDPKFNMTVNKLEGDGDVLIYMNTELTNPVTQALTRNEQMKILGVGDFKSTAWKIDILSQTRDMEMYMYSGYSESIMAGMLMQSVPLMSPHIVPASNADIFYAFNTGNFASMWDRFLDSVKNSANKQEYIDIQNGIAKFEIEKGLNIRNDILDSLSGEVGIAFGMTGLNENPEGTGSLMQSGIMIFLGIRDRDKIKMCIDKLFADQPMEKTQYKGVEIRYTPTMSTAQGPFGYIFADDMFVLSNMKRLMAVIDDEKPLITSESFAELGTRLSGSGNSIFYINLNKIMSQIPASEGEPSKTMFFKDMGIIAGMMSFDGEGFRTKITGNKSKSWIDIAGEIIDMSIKSKIKD